MEVKAEEGMEGKREEGENEACAKQENLDDDDDDDVVMSEVHLGCPPNNRGPFTSHFTFSLLPPQQLLHFDEDGDLILRRRSTSSSTKECNSHTACITIQHHITSTLPAVGLQVWRAELILADYVLHNMLSSSTLNSAVAIELGAGTGLAGILIAQVAEVVFITDHGIEILDNCAANVDINSGMLSNKSSVKVRELDWLNPWPPLNLEAQTRYSCTPSEVEEVSRASVLLAADVIYSDALTDAFFCILKKLLCNDIKKVLYLALEKRYNFTMNDLDIVANGYSHFLSYLSAKNGFAGKRIDLSDVPQYVRGYERGTDVELWEICCVAEKH